MTHSYKVSLTFNPAL